MPETLVLVDRPAEGVALITLNRPDKYNAILPETLGLLGDHLRACADDDSVRAIVLTGAVNGVAITGGLEMCDTTGQAALDLEARYAGLQADPEAFAARREATFSRGKSQQ